MSNIARYMKLLEYLEVLRKFKLIDEKEYNEIRNLLTDKMVFG